MSRHHCYVHNVDYKYNCPECRDEETDRFRGNLLESLSSLSEFRTDNSDIAEGLSDLETQVTKLILQQSSPGDYKCPECLYLTLKRGASRCPKCHAGVSKKYWEEVEKTEKIKERERKEELKRIQKELEEKERQKRLEEENKRKAEEYEIKLRKEKKEAVASFFILSLFLIGSIALFAWILDQLVKTITNTVSEFLESKLFNSIFWWINFFVGWTMWFIQQPINLFSWILESFGVLGLAVALVGGGFIMLVIIGIILEKTKFNIHIVGLDELLSLRGEKVAVIRCYNCQRDTKHNHIHDMAHGIAKTHMAGTERYRCIGCRREITKSSPDAIKFNLPFYLD